MTADETLAQLAAVVLAGVEMRTAQATYFKSRKTDALIASKNAERAFDLLAGRALSTLKRDFPQHINEPQMNTTEPQHLRRGGSP